MIKNILTLLLVGTLMPNCDQSPETSKNMETSESTTETKATIREKNMSTVRDFFELMHQKNLAKWSNLWDENGFIYIPYPVSNFPDTIKSKKTISEGFQKLFAGFKSFNYQITEIYPSLDPDIIVVEYTVIADLIKTNTTYNGNNIAVFKFRNGYILAYHDYFNPEKFKMVIETIS